jgi:hypothetical protein
MSKARQPHTSHQHRKTGKKGNYPFQLFFLPVLIPKPAFQKKVFKRIGRKQFLPLPLHAVHQFIQPGTGNSWG